MENKLFVGNLSYEITDNDLMDAFSAYGSVLEANVMQDRMTGRSRGFGFVTMSSSEEAHSAIEGLHGTDLGGRSLTVNVARPREERGGGGGRPPRRDYGGGGNRY
ncbi:MAG: RNA recognition motif domain-containing protein [Limisphaerales bacterium]|jgi:cold-inducible RNA-binding protein